MLPFPYFRLSSLVVSTKALQSDDLLFPGKEASFCRGIGQYKAILKVRAEHSGQSEGR